MNDAWAEYVEALGALARAPETAHSKRYRIDERETQAMCAADASLRSVVAQRGELELRARRLDELVSTMLADNGIAGGKPVLPVRVPRPTTIGAALEECDRMECQVRHDVERLQAARAAPRPPVPTAPQDWRPYALSGVAVLAFLVLVVVMSTL